MKRRRLRRRLERGRRRWKERRCLRTSSRLVGRRWHVCRGWRADAQRCGHGDGWSGWRRRWWRLRWQGSWCCCLVVVCIPHHIPTVAEIIGAPAVMKSMTWLATLRASMLPPRQVCECTSCHARPCPRELVRTTQTNSALCHGAQRVRKVVDDFPTPDQKSYEQDEYQTMTDKDAQGRY